MPAAQFDFIVIGAGSAGCALVYQLVRNPAHRVLLVEAGSSHHELFVTMPMGFPMLHDNPRTDWMYRQERPSNRRAETSTWKAGRLLGGGSSINGMVYVRGQPEDYDDWARLGNPGWGWRDVLPVFRAIEDHQLGADALRGAGGPLPVTCTAEPNPLSDAWIEAGNRLGLPRRDDLNGEDQVGIGYYPRTIFRGRRQSAAVAFLDRVIDRPNLTVMKNAEVRRIVIEDHRAVGVECVTRSGVHNFRATRELILSAGAIGSPRLLQHSGIGPAAHLRTLGIEVVRDLPGVGANLQEHFMSGCVHTVRHGSLNAEVRGLRLVKNLTEWLLFHRGVMAMAAAQAGAFFKTQPDLARADAQLLMAPLCMAGKSDPATPSVSAPSERVVPASVGGFTAFGCPTRPSSRGSVLIRSPDFMIKPCIRYEHLRSEKDQAAIIAIIRFVRELAAQPALAAYGPTEVLPGPAVRTDEALLDHALNTGQLGYHPAGTCRMGGDAMAVVDHRLRVAGIHGLRVADASIMPVITSGNTNAPAMMIGFKAGAMIAAEHGC